MVDFPSLVGWQTTGAPLSKAGGSHPDAAGMDPARIAEVISATFTDDASNDIVLDNKTVNNDYQEPINDEPTNNNPITDDNAGFIVDTNDF